MPPPYPLGENVTILRSGEPTQDSHGNDVPGTDAETAVEGCAVWPRTSSESIDGRDQVIVGVSVGMPYGTDVRATDRVRWRGTVYEVAGRPGPWRNPFTGTCAGIQVDLTEVTG